MEIMVKIIKEEIPIEESLKRKLEFICEFTKTTPTIINGNIRKIDKTNLTYIEPHRIIMVQCQVVLVKPKTNDK